ncbi:MAG: hypothetical protein ABIK44_02070 [candidate division WOR-3 bacterium]
MQVTTLAELKDAARRQEPEILIVDKRLADRVALWNGLRLAANIVVFVILAVAIFMWANPIHWELLEGPDARLARQIMLGVGILLLFADYLLPVVRTYKVAERSPEGLKLVLRRPR